MQNYSTHFEIWERDQLHKYFQISNWGIEGPGYLSPLWYINRPNRHVRRVKYLKVVFIFFVAPACLDRFPASLACGRASGLGTLLSTPYHAKSHIPCNYSSPTYPGWSLQDVPGSHCRKILWCSPEKYATLTDNLKPFSSNSEKWFTSRNCFAKSPSLPPSISELRTSTKRLSYGSGILGSGFLLGLTYKWNKHHEVISIEGDFIFFNYMGGQTVELLWTGLTWKYPPRRFAETQIRTIYSVTPDEVWSPNISGVKSVFSWMRWWIWCMDCEACKDEKVKLWKLNWKDTPVNLSDMTHWACQKWVTM